MCAANKQAVVSYPAKVQIFQLITTMSLLIVLTFCCFLPCKGTNFSANHNYFRYVLINHIVVSYPAKVQIFQLITTNCHKKKRVCGCFLPCKGTNFSANHNGEVILCLLQLVVSYPAKVQIFQLITTNVGMVFLQPQLFLTLQRYKFFS